MKTIKVAASACLLFTLFFIFNCYDVNAQIQTARYNSIISNSNAFYEYLPQGYNSDLQTYPLLVFLTGVGELGDGSPSQLTTVLRNGPPKLINNGTFPVSFTVNGEVFKFIVISPQFLNWPVADDIQGVIDYAVKNYRVNTKRIYVTGLSMGGGVTWDYGSFKAAYANRIAALVPVCGASGPTADKVNVIVSANLPVWALHNQGDDQVPVANTISYVDDINASMPPPKIPAKKTIFSASGHDAWTTSYDPAYKENNLNIYEWMLQYQRDTAHPVNQVPVSNAGSDIILTLPTNGVTLAGNGTDNDGTITSYSWSEISGPSKYDINNSNLNTPLISNLVAGNYTLRLTVTDNSGATASDDVTIVVNPSSTTTATIPGKIEAENYMAMYGIQTENASDAGGGKDVGFIDSGDWMDYNATVSSAGTYTVNFRVASPNTAQQLQLKNSSGTVLATVDIPQTGYYQTWATVSAMVTLPAGNQTLRISSVNGGWNINWLEFLSVGKSLVAGQAIPGKIEAENYTTMSGVQSEATTDIGTGKDVGFIDTGDWMDYNATVSSAGLYTVNFRVASPYTSQQLQLKNSSGTILATVNIPQTGYFQTWTTVSTTVTLPVGNQTLRISSGNGGWNINWVEFISGGQIPSGVAIPGKIEAENYDAMSGVLTENTSDIAGGKDVGWIDAGDWMDYNTTVSSAGVYTINFRVASPYTAQQLQLKNSSGTILATVNIPQTGDFQTWTTVSTTVTLPTGNQTIRIYSGSAGWNINWVEFLSGTQTLTGAMIPGKIEAENYAAMSGIGTENTSDAGGGKNVGWVDTGDWMDYNATVSTAGNYTVNFRLAAAYYGQQLQLRNSSGAVLGTLSVPETGGYQAWTTASIGITLPAGYQTIRIYSLNGSWNINWVEFVSGGITTNATISNGLPSTIPDQVNISKEKFNISPNPVLGRFSLQLNNSHLGTVDIRISDLSGKVMKTFKFEKTQQFSDLNLMVNELLPGIYFMKVQIGNWTGSTKIIKM